MMWVKEVIEKEEKSFQNINFDSTPMLTLRDARWTKRDVASKQKLEQSLLGPL